MSLARVVPVASVPTIQYPISFKLCTAVSKLFTYIIGVYSIAPVDTCATTSVTLTLLLLGKIIKSYPNASTLRMIAPKLCGSCTPSKINILPLSFLNLFKSSIE